MFKRHLAFSEASERQNHSEVLYLNLFKKTTTCVVAKPLVCIIIVGVDSVSLYKSASLSVSESVCLFVCSLTPPKRRIPAI